MRFALLSVIWVTFPAFSAELAEGRYRIEYRSEFPHLERYSTTRSVYRCLREAPWPIIGDAGAFGVCPTSGAEANGGRVSYRIACPGVAGARASAVYDIDGDRFTARIHLKLGAKNMTSVEVQKGIRTGPCGDEGTQGH